MRLMHSLEQMKIDLDNPQSDIIMRGVGNHSYVSTSVHRLKNAVLNIHMALLLSFYGKPFQLIKKKGNGPSINLMQANRMSFQPEIIPNKVESPQIVNSSNKYQYFHFLYILIKGKRLKKGF
jgi:hypothetical protein